MRDGETVPDMPSDRAQQQVGQMTSSLYIDLRNGKPPFAIYRKAVHNNILNNLISIEVRKTFGREKYMNLWKIFIAIST